MDQSVMLERQSVDVDIVCVGFGPAMGGFLTTLCRRLRASAGGPAFESRALPGLPLQIVCYERADDISFGVSGVATRARGIFETFPDLDPSSIPMAHRITREKLLYLLDPIGASRRRRHLRVADRLIRALGRVLRFEHEALELGPVPGFLRKENGLVLSVGQFNHWVGSQLVDSGLIQLWPGLPVQEPLIENDRVMGVRLVDQGTDKSGQPAAGYLPGMDVHAALTVVGDGPVGPVGRRLDQHFGLPEGHSQRDWAVGMKMVVDLAVDSPLEPGTVLHTFGYPEPEIFGFLYVYPDRMASLGIFVPSWLDSPVRTSYRYLQHWMTHPYLWRYLKGARMRSWGAKTIQESGRRGEPHLAGNGWARIGESSGSTNVLTGSGVDEAWATGTILAESVVELLREQKPFSRENLEKTYVRRRRSSWVEVEGQVAERARDGFQRDVLAGLIGMTLTGLTRGRLNFPARFRRPGKRIPSLEEYYRGRISVSEIEHVRNMAARKRTSLHDALMERCGWPPIAYDGKLLLSQQDALLIGGKVQAPPGYPDHVVFLYPSVCERCESRLCIEICSAQAITPGDESQVPEFDREKCIHCGACFWSCPQPLQEDTEHGNIAFNAGAGGLHSAEN